MIPVYICEDDAQQLKLLKSLVVEIINDEGLDGIKLAYATKYPTEILEKMDTDEISLYLLDIDFGENEMSGLDLASKIRSRNINSWIVMITAYNFALKTYRMKIGVKDYVLKGDTELMAIRIKECLKDLHNSVRLVAIDNDNYLRIGNSFKMKAEEIYYISVVPSEKRKLEIYRKNGFSTISGILKDLIYPHNAIFFQCGRSYVINLNHVRKIDKVNKCVVMDNGANIPITKKLIRALETKLLSQFY
jgi:two-component system response regulator AgrA